MSSLPPYSGKGSQTPADVEALVSSYVALCNQVLAEHDHKLWFRQARQLGMALVGGTCFSALVYDRNPANGLAEFTLCIDRDEQAFRLLPPSHQDVAFTWRVPVDYLQDVVQQRPGWYRDNPLMLDLAWMQARLRDEAAQRVNSGTLAVAFLAGMIVATLRR
jgi:hypothetical protein